MKPLSEITPLRQEQQTEVNPVVPAPASPASPASIDDIPTGPAAQTKSDLEAVAELADAHKQIVTEIEKKIIGQKKVVDQLLVALFARGHTLFVGVPGLAKTLLISTLAETLNLSFQRIQFTPDLLPADVVGTQIYNPQSGAFTVKQGPIFGNIVLADEINRAPAKVQSALIQAMEERQATIGEGTFPMPRPFFVLATQNPIEQEGTYPLPEAQLDRFMLKVQIGYPSRADELLILDRMGSLNSSIDIPAVIGPQDLEQLRQAADAVYVDQKVKEYLLDVIRATRNPGEYGLDLGGLIQLGGSTRAVIALLRAVKAHAFLAGRGYVTPEDVKAMAPEVLRHRLAISFEAEAEDLRPDNLVKQVLDRLPVP
jgi:MoxR-like ATPase